MVESYSRQDSKAHGMVQKENVNVVEFDQLLRPINIYQLKNN